ncbi:MAG: hypothetical protein PHW43_09650, partial [Syntrophales bacterium]|nr:hypothetical protein [Syntrophales bacterium]
MAGEINNALPKSKELLANIAKTIKKGFYSLSSKGQERALSLTLKTANDFLGQEVKKENVNWLGNLNFAAIGIKGSDLVFTKTGDIKILLIRGGQINDAGRNLNLEGIDPYPLKVFFNIATGKLFEGDILMVLSSNVFNFIKEKGILQALAKAENIDDKKIKEILPYSLFTKGAGSAISGFSLIFLFNKQKEKFSFPTLFKSEEENKEKPNKINPFLEKIKAFPKKLAFNMPSFPKLSQRKIFLPKIKNPFKGLTIEQFKKKPAFKKNALLVLGFLFLLLIGFLIFKGAENRKEETVIVNNPIEPTNLEKIEPNALFDLSKEELGFEPNKIALSFANLYLYKESSPEIFKINIDSSKKEKTELNQSIESIDANSGTPLAFSLPNTVYYFKNSAWQEKQIALAPSNFNLDLSGSYLLNIYFLNAKNCYIIKYSYLSDYNWGSPKKWYEDVTNTCKNPKSMAVDGSVWILNQDNTITRYYTGEFQDKITLDIFPVPEDLTEIKTTASAPYIYILEPKNNRLLIADKTGKFIKQIQSDKFNNLKSFAISENGTTAYLLNGYTIYKIEL